MVTRKERKPYCRHVYEHDKCVHTVHVYIYLYKLTAVFSDVVTGLVGCQTLQNFNSPPTPAQWLQYLVVWSLKPLWVSPTRSLLPLGVEFGCGDFLGQPWLWTAPSTRNETWLWYDEKLASSSWQLEIACSSFLSEKNALISKLISSLIVNRGHAKNSWVI